MYQAAFFATFSIGRNARFTNTIATENAGRSSSACLRFAGSVPASAPMIGELAASPIHPQVITMPIAVAVPLGNASATIASVVGNTGAIARPAQNTAIPAIVASLDTSIIYVVIAIRTEDASV